MPNKPPTPFQVRAARRVDRNALMGTGDDRYESNMYGMGPGNKPATGTVEPMAKVANARSIARKADRDEYVADMKKKGGLLRALTGKK